jgi:hypothetical protein
MRMSTLVKVQPKDQIDRTRFLNADDEYTPAQRRLISARLDKAEKGPFYGPFKDGVEVAAFLGRKVRSTARSAKLKKLGSIIWEGPLASPRQ